MTGPRMPEPAVIVFLQTDITKGESGYTSRCRDQVRFFSRRGRTIVYSFYEDALRPWDTQAIARFRADFPDVELVLDHRSKPLNALQRLKNLLVARAPKRAAAIARMSVPGATPAFDRLARQHPEALFFVNLSEALHALNGLPFRRLVIDTHDVRFLKRMAMDDVPAFDPRTVTTMRGELAVLSLADAIVAIAPNEQVLFRALLPQGRVLYVPDFADRMAATEPREAAVPREYELLFIGSEYVFNVEGLCDFVARNLDWLRDHRLAVAGRVCGVEQVKATAAQVPSATLLGFVDDLPALYDRTGIAISPVRGTGLKIKILEALAAGVPVFASAESLDGLPPGYEGCVFLEETAAMTRLLHDPEALRAASLAALRYSAVLAEAPDLRVLSGLAYGDAA